jgi:hypothetical protein
VKRAGRAVVVSTVVLALTVGAAGHAPAKPVVKGKPEIKLATKTTHAGPHPLLQWKPVTAATGYLVVVQTPKGDPYWTWQGGDTSVLLGAGAPTSPKQSEGASLVRKMRWFVIARNADGSIVASSAKRPIAP